MTELQVSQNVLLKLLPFIGATVLYFVLFIPSGNPSLFAMVVKCLPIFSLIAFVLFHEMTLGLRSSFSNKIVLGLIFSSIGDALLIWPKYFPHGMAAFAVAQIMYIKAFGFQPLKLKLGIFLYIISAPALAFILSNVADPLIFYGLPIYSVLLVTTVWRACARNLGIWTELGSCLGVILFFISDSVIGLNQFYTQIPHAQAIIMSTYYMAQLGITLSTLSSYQPSTQKTN